MAEDGGDDDGGDDNNGVHDSGCDANDIAVLFSRPGC